MKGRERRGWASPQLSLNLVLQLHFRAKHNCQREACFQPRPHRLAFSNIGGIRFPPIPWQPRILESRRSSPRSSIPILMPCLRQAPHKGAKICVTRAWRLAVASGFWDSTVTIEIGGKSTAYARITTTRGAASYLIEQWPGSRDQSYKEAIVSCTRALKGELNDEAVFASFVKAVVVSGLKHSSAPARLNDEFEETIMAAARQSLLDDLRQFEQTV